MRKAGGIIAIIAGLLGFLAAAITLMIGGIGSNFNAEGGNAIVNLGWGGLFISLLIIVLGAVAMNAKTLISGILIIVASIFGAAYGGSLVAILMILALVGGILACFGDNNFEQNESEIVAPKSVMDSLIVVVGIAGSILVGILYFSKPNQNNSETPASITIPEETEALDADISIKPNGELAAIFSYNSDYTDLQRELKLRDIKGKIIDWTLPVYDVKSTDTGYRVQTDSHYKNDFFGERLVGTFINITTKNDDEQQFVENLKTGDLIHIKGIIDDVSLRNLHIASAIILPAGDSPAEEKPVAEMPSADAALPEQSPKKSINFYIGQPPLELMKNEDILQISKKLMGIHYDKFLSNIALSSGMEMDSHYLLGYGCSEGVCPTEQSAFAIDKETGEMFAILVSSDGDHLFGADSIDKFPSNLKTWYQQLEK